MQILINLKIGADHFVGGDIIIMIIKCNLKVLGLHDITYSEKKSSTFSLSEFSILKDTGSVFVSSVSSKVC